MRPPIILYQPPRRLRTDYRIGLSAWTDKSMIEDGQFYPPRTMTAEERLWWYSRYFDVVEVNSSFYAIPSPETAATWVERTPPDFPFNVKAYGLLTGHHVDAARLPDELRKLLPGAIRNKKSGRIPNDRIPEEARAWSFDAMQAAVAPLRHAGKLGGTAERVHVAMNNNNRDYPARNGIQLKEMLLEDWQAPDRDALIEELEERRAAARQRKPRGKRAAA